MAPNVGAILRLGACLDLPVHVVEPCGFPFSPQAWARQAMDYARMVTLRHHSGWHAFAELAGDAARSGAPGRLIALSARATISLYEVAFQPGDCLMLGAESAGLPAEAFAAAALSVAIPMCPPARSLNIAQAAAMAAGEALRQLDAWPAPQGLGVTPPQR